ncbi:MAG: metallophosphoesterase [Pirellulales bacterium]
MISLLYNALMAVGDLGGLALLRRRPTFVRAFLVSAGLAFPAAVLALLLGETAFGSFRLLAYGVFGHGTAFLAGAAVVLWRPRRKTALACAAAAVCLALVAMDAFWFEPTWLEVSHLRLESAKLRRAVKIVVIADLQTDEIGAYERDVFRRAMDEKPDLILLAGDYLHASPSRRAELARELGSYLKEIGFAAPLGVYAIEGNIDPPDWPDSFAGLPVTIVRQTRTFDLGEFDLTCLGLRDSLDTSLSVAESKRFHVVLGHSPNFAMGRVPADLLLAGHTHGGQVRLPWIGPLMTLSNVPRRWAAGVTELGGGRTLVVSRGIGVERGYAPRLRFLCRPELVVVELAPEP